MADQDFDHWRRLAAEERSPAAIGAMIPWFCEYDGPDGRYAIILHGTDPEQVWRDNEEALPGLHIVGISWGQVDG